MQTSQYLEEVAIFRNYPRFSADLGEDVSRDVIAICVQPKPSSSPVRLIWVQLNGLHYQHTWLWKTAQSNFSSSSSFPQKKNKFWKKPPQSKACLTVTITEKNAVWIEHNWCAVLIVVLLVAVLTVVYCIQRKIRIISKLLIQHCFPQHIVFKWFQSY